MNELLPKNSIVKNNGESMSGNEFLVCIRCMTYNQSAYISDALNGFAMQQTNFPFLAVIVDDASTDGEQEVIKSYVEEHFDHSEKTGYREWETEDAHWTFARHKENDNCHFVVVFLKRNLYKESEKKKAIIKDWVEAKYVAFCEGDDYWIDTMKLQKQLDFLEGNEEYDMVCTRFRKLQDSNGAYIDSDLYDGIIREDMCGLELLHEHFLSSALPQPCTVMYRNGTIDSALIQKIKYKFDIPLYWCFMYDHRVWLINERMSVYRIHEGSVSQSGVSDTWNIYAAYLDILQYDSGNPILRKLCASSYRSCYAIPAAYRDDYGFVLFLHDFKRYLSYRPTVRNVVSLVYKITKIRIKRKNT